MTGLIAFFDILGYQSFLKNNSAEESALKVLDLISTTPATLKITLGRSVQQAENHAMVWREMKHLIFSDTILMSIQYPTNASQVWKDTAAEVIAGFSGALFGKMLINGLPMRCGIVEGQFFIKENCFAGEAIVNAYELCHSLDFSGIVFDTVVADGLRKIVGSSESDEFLVSYLSQLKESKEQKLTHFNWIALLKEDQTAALRTDIETFIHRAFWAHNKDCPLSVDRKIANTIKLCRRLFLALDFVKTKPS